MRLLSIEVSGVRRLLDTKCHLGGKVTAIVGPNEAGKSTLLFALKSINDNGGIPASTLSRVRPPGDADVVIATDWELEEADIRDLDEWDLEDTPVRLRIEKQAAGKRLVQISPEPRRRSAPFMAAVRPLGRFLDSRAGQALDRSDPDDEEAEPEIGDDLDYILAELSSGVWRNWDQSVIDRVAHAKDELLKLTKSKTALSSRTAKALDLVNDAARARDPRQVWEALLGRVPMCIEFNQVDRDLASSYQLDGLDLINPPAALANLASLANLNLSEFSDHVNRGNLGMAATVLRAANSRLAEFYGDRWKQSKLHVALDRDGMRLDILIEEEGGGTYVLNERSDGLRTFVALTAFLARHGLDKPVLLIDEAETHLHYDAQRDLVDVLIEQQAAQQVIYTTHSPGCLPPDLGTGVRAVVPDEGRPGVSAIKNEFWSANSPGFSPLLLMMGAAAAAFATTRAALLVEGPSEMILLPTLLKLALGNSTLPYHIAPGLSTTTPERYAEFDLVAARLMYLVDGDAGGDAIRRSLTAHGVPDKRILALGGLNSGLTLEDLVSARTFQEALNRELYVTGQDTLGPIPEALGRYNSAKRMCQSANLRMPSKVAIAGRMLWNPEQIELAPSARSALQSVHREVSRRLDC